MADTHWRDTAAAFVVGLGVGALVGILLAPASGERTRKRLRGAIESGYEEAVSKGQKLVDSAADALDDLRERVGDAADAGQKVMQQVKSAVS